MKMTTDEIKVVTFTLVALLAGATCKYYRTTHPVLPKPSPAPRNQPHRPW